MPTEVTAWKDEAGDVHATKEAAIAADDKRTRLHLLHQASKAIAAASPFDDDAHTNIFQLEKLDGMNEETLQPLADYITLLIKESKERQEKYG